MPTQHLLFCNTATLLIRVASARLTLPLTHVLIFLSTLANALTSLVICAITLYQVAADAPAMADFHRGSASGPPSDERSAALEQSVSCLQQDVAEIKRSIERMSHALTSIASKPNVSPHPQ